MSRRHNRSICYECKENGSQALQSLLISAGKTLALSLPILESLTNCQHKASKKTEYGRSPSVLVLLPTRELAIQVHAVFEAYGPSVGLFSCCLYGGTNKHLEQRVLERGVDVVIGTPGRIKDHLESKLLNLKSVKIRVLDEADQLLHHTFIETVDDILITLKFQKDSKKIVDLVVNERMKGSESVRHVLIPCSMTAKTRIIPDLVLCHSRADHHFH